MRRRYIGLMFHIDTNRINARQILDNMNRFETWGNNGVILLEKSEKTLHEASAGSDIRRKKKAIEGFFSMTYADTPEEKNKLLRIEEILFPNGAKNENQKNDVEIVFNAGKYCRYLVTNDGGSKNQPGGMLGNAERLKQEMDIKVMTDEDAVALVEKRIKSRDTHCRIISERTGEPLPDWVEKD